jgi:hydroxypyruvate reductase/glycerate 2-kinase
MARWSQFQNRSALLAHGPTRLREQAVVILESGVRAADPYLAVRQMMSRNGKILNVDGAEYNLDSWRRIFVIGAGKATQSLALAVEDVLGDYLTGGLVVVKRGEVRGLSRIPSMEAAHPVPDQASYEGAQRIAEIAQTAEANDLVVATFTGGSSALLTLPPEGVPLRDKQELNQILLDSGMSIIEMNNIRKHVSQIKGGWLGQSIFPADLISLTVSDVIDDPVDYITDLTVPDTSTYLDAWKALDKYKLWDRVPISIRQYLKRGEEIETPKQYDFPYQVFTPVTSRAACEGAAQRCCELGYTTEILTHSMEGESSLQARGFVDAAFEFANQHSGQPCAVLASGETVVTLIDEEHGEGGPNQEFALSAALAIEGCDHVVITSIGTDGTDGPGDACGGLVDGETTTRAQTRGLNPTALLEQHASQTLLAATGDLLISGPTGTNVNDVILALIEQ